MFGWFSEASICASRWNRARRSGSLANDVGQDLDRDVAIQLRVARAIDLAHAAGADRHDDFVRAEASAGNWGMELQISEKCSFTSAGLHGNRNASR